jgi:dipeptidyl aminopeptidase/acylaminoacyl peptidase
VTYLDDRRIADTQRVCIVGASYGGYAALAGAAFTPELYACAVSVNGIADIPQMAGFIREHSGEESDAFRYWQHPRPPSQSRIFAQLVKQRDKHYELVELPDEDHLLSSGQSRLTVLEALDRFLAANLR